MRNDPTPPGRLHRLLLLDVGHNALSGGIPATIANVIRMLHALDLSFNQLSGPIPTELQGLRDLGRVSLQMNYLSGFIPNDLFNNTPLLTYLNLDNNSLSGPCNLARSHQSCLWCGRHLCTRGNEARSVSAKSLNAR